VVTLSSVGTSIPLASPTFTYYLLVSGAPSSTVNFYTGGTLINSTTTNYNNFYKANSVYTSYRVYYNSLVFINAITPPQFNSVTLKTFTFYTPSTTISSTTASFSGGCSSSCSFLGKAGTIFDLYDGTHTYTLYDTVGSNTVVAIVNPVLQIAAVDGI
jgi:hypothetical protein